MTRLALFDLDYTLLPLDSDYEWGQFLVKIGAVEGIEFMRRNAAFYAQYQAGTQDPVEYLEFALGTLAGFPRATLDAYHAQFMQEVITPALLPAAHDLLKKHQDAGDLIAIVTATNHFITRPIAAAFGVEHLLAAMPELTVEGNFTGKIIGLPNLGASKIFHTKKWLATLNKTLENFTESHFYSDSHNDIPLLSIVTHPVATNPDAQLAAHAQALGWPILHLFKDHG